MGGGGGEEEEGVITSLYILNDTASMPMPGSFFSFSLKLEELNNGLLNHGRGSWWCRRIEDASKQEHSVFILCFRKVFDSSKLVRTQRKDKKTNSKLFLQHSSVYCNLTEQTDTWYKKRTHTQKDRSQNVETKHWWQLHDSSKVGTNHARVQGFSLLTQYWLLALVGCCEALPEHPSGFVLCFPTDDFALLKRHVHLTQWTSARLLAEAEHDRDIDCLWKKQKSMHTQIMQVVLWCNG